MVLGGFVSKLNTKPTVYNMIQERKLNQRVSLHILLPYKPLKICIKFHTCFERVKIT